MPKYLFLALVLLVPRYIFATTHILIFDGTTVFIGSDGLETIAGLPKFSRFKSQRKCKLLESKQSICCHGDMRTNFMHHRSRALLRRSFHSTNSHKGLWRAGVCAPVQMYGPPPFRK
jgi:hypothetical protein